MDFLKLQLMRYFLFVLVISFLSNCRNKDNVHTANYYIVNFDQDVTKKLNLDAIVDSLNFTFLQYDEQNPVGEILNFKITENYLWVVDNQQKLFVFKKNGDLVSVISHKGKGPEEYGSIEDFTIDSNEEYVLVLSPGNGKIIKYNLTGEYIAGYSIGFNHATHISNLNDSTYCIYQSARFSKADINIFILGENFQILDSIVDPGGRALKEIPYLLDVCWYNHSNNIYYKEVFVDTVFKITKRHSKEPHILFSLGEKRMPDKYYSNTGPYQNNYHKFFQVGDIKESENYVFMLMVINNEKKYFIHHKNIEQRLVEVLPKSLDMDIEFWPGYIYDETMYGFIGATRLSDKLGSTPAENKIRRILESNNNSVLISGKLVDKIKGDN